MSDSGQKTLRETTQATNVAHAAWPGPLEFKTISTPRGRKGIRMETVFWNALADMAESRGAKLSELLLPLVEDAEARGENVTSAIRSFIVAASREELQLYRDLANPARLIELLQQAPVPSFAMNRKKAVLRANPEFRHYLRVLSGDMKGPISPEIAQLSVEMPLLDLFDALAQSSTVQCGVTIRVDNRQKTSLARFVPVPGLRVSAVVGYLVS